MFFQHVHFLFLFISIDIVGHQVTIIKEESVEAQTGCNLEIGTYVPFVCSLFGADRLSKLAQPTVEDLEPLAHRTLSGAPIRPLARPPSRADCAADRWLTGQSGAPPDSPVNYSRTPVITSRERRLRL